MADNTEEDINQLQLFEQSIQNLLIQKQQFQSQLIEIDSALKELASSKESYKIIGNIMVSADNSELQKELESRKETMGIRIRTLEKQENTIKEKAEKLQAEVMKKIKK